MIPDPLDHTEVQAETIDRLALGEKGIAVARDLGVAASTVSAFRRRGDVAPLIEARRNALLGIAFRAGEQESRFQKMILALLEAGADRTNRGQAQAARVYGEYVGAIGGPRDLTINGDVTVDQSTVSVDARAIHLAAGDPKARAERAAELDRLLGIG